MCCNTKAGPRIALQHLSNAAGLQLTQEDWHQMRAYSGEFLGRELSSGRATARERASAAVRLMHQFAGSDAEMQEFARSFAIATNTQGTIDTLNGAAAELRKFLRTPVTLTFAPAILAAQIEIGETFHPSDRSLRLVDKTHQMGAELVVRVGPAETASGGLLKCRVLQTRYRAPNAWRHRSVIQN